MASEVEICNLALNSLGQTIPIANLTERSKEAKLCATHYPQVRDELLSMHPWPFARKAQALVLVADAPLIGWEYQYAYPQTCLRAWRVCREDGIRQTWRDLCLSWDWHGQRYATMDVPFELTSGSQQTCLATDLEDAYLLFTSKVTDTNRFSPLFVNALAQMLASRLAMPLAVDPRRQQMAAELAYNAMQYAMAEALNEGVEDPDRTTPSISVRG